MGFIDRLLANAPSSERAEAAIWLQLVARSLIKGGAETILANPQRFLRVKKDETALIKRVGGVMSGLVIGPDKITFQALLSSEGLNKVVKAVLESVSKNPDLLKVGDQGIKKILQAVAASLAKLPAPFSPDLFPDLITLILEKSAENMDLIWGKRFSSPDRHLLVTATKMLLLELTKAHSPASKWRPALTQQQLLVTVEAVLDEVIDNPAWLIARAQETDPNLAAAVKAVVESLKGLDGSKVSADAGVAVLRAAITAVGKRISFLADLSEPGAQSARIAITATLNAIFETIFAPDVPADAQWKLGRNSVLISLAEVGLQELTEAGATDDEIKALRQTIKAALDSSGPFRAEDFRKDLRTRLANT